MLVAVDDVVGRQELAPDGRSLVVALQTFFGSTLKHRSIKVFRVDLQHIHNIFPCPRYRFLLEIITKTPVAEHLEHGVMVGVVSHLLQVVVLAAHAKAFLRVGHALAFGLYVAKNDVLELVHTCIGEHQCGVVLDDHWGGRHDKVLFAFKEFLERLPDFICCH